MPNHPMLRALRALLTVVLIAPPAVSQTTMNVLYYFIGAGDGGHPIGALVHDDDGNLYGTTYTGGAYGYGTVFEVDSSGTESVLYSFAGGTDGSNPAAGLVRDIRGNLYGTTYYGGTSGMGTVFKLESDGTESVLHSFTGGPDGANPFASLTRDGFGDLYGTTYAGGKYGFGSVFLVDWREQETVLYSFSGGTDGAHPLAGLIRDLDGNLFGTTYDGGLYGYGDVFKVGPGGKQSVLHSFDCCRIDGSNPQGGLVSDGAGNLYGTTYSGGASNGGIVFVISGSGREVVLYNFPPSGIFGANPVGGVIRDSGNLYGTTLTGGPAFSGTVYKLDESHNFSVLHDFKWTDGAMPEASLISDSQGNLYGTTHAGGTYGFGSVFKLTFQ